MSDAVRVVGRFWELMAGNDFAAVAEVLAPGYVLDWPQSNERIRGAERFARVNAEYPAHGPWRFTVRRLLGDATQAASEVEVSDGVVEARVVSFFEVRAGRIQYQVEYWPEPFAPGSARAHLTEPIR